MLGDWLQFIDPLYQPIRHKTHKKTNPDLLTRVFPTVKVINCIFPFMIAFLVLFLLVKVIISVLVLRHSIENRFNFCK